jgi:hypothetical protein
MRSYTVKHISVWLQIRRAALLLFDMYVHLQLVLKAFIYDSQQVELLMVVCVVPCGGHMS